MARRLPLGPTAGFPNCARCRYFQGGSADVCFTCASEAIEAVSEHACPTCSQGLLVMEWDGTKYVEQCSNKVCRMQDRRISSIGAIAVHSGALRSRNLNYKYDGVKGWAVIFGRLLLGYLESHRTSRPRDLIVANPTYLGPGERSTLPHTELVIEVAANEDLFGSWPFDVGEPRLIVKTGPTPKSAGGGWQAKREAAQALRDVWQLTDLDAFVGKRVLVYDDVCTTGLQLDALAGFLIDEGGAADVSGVVLGRAPWK